MVPGINHHQEISLSSICGAAAVAVLVVALIKVAVAVVHMANLIFQCLLLVLQNLSLLVVEVEVVLVEECRNLRIVTIRLMVDKVVMVVDILT